MDGRFIVPIATMLAGVIVFLVFAIRHALAGKPNASPPWLGAGACLAAGGLMVFSGFS